MLTTFIRQETIFIFFRIEEWLHLPQLANFYKIGV